MGSSVIAQGTGFGSLEQVRIYWSHPKILLGTVNTTISGSFDGSSTLTFTVPAGAPSGLNKLEAVGLTSAAKAYASFTVE